MARKTRQEAAQLGFVRLRDEICLRAKGGEGQLLVVTSARHGEGRTLVSRGLAEAFGGEADGAETILVDFDLRHPGIHTRFGLPAAPGVSDCLRGAAEVIEALHPVLPGSLSVLPAGTRSLGATRHMSAPGMSALLKVLRELRATVIIDSPPLEEGIAAQLLASAADAVLLVARSNRTERADLQAAARDLTAAGAVLLGVVVNDLQDGAAARMGAGSASDFARPPRPLATPQPPGRSGTTSA